MPMISPDLHGVKISGHKTDLVHGKFDKAFFSGRRGNTDGNFPFAGNRKLRELTGPVGKFFFIPGFKKTNLNVLSSCLPFRLLFHLYEPDKAYMDFAL